MSGGGDGPTVNQDPAPEREREEVGEAAGNVREKGRDPSPGDRERGESCADPPAPADLDAVRDRSS